MKIRFDDIQVWHLFLKFVSASDTIEEINRHSIAILLDHDTQSVTFRGPDWQSDRRAIKLFSPD